MSIVQIDAEAASTIKTAKKRNGTKTGTNGRKNVSVFCESVTSDLCLLVPDSVSSDSGYCPSPLCPLRKKCFT